MFSFEDTLSFRHYPRGGAPLSRLRRDISHRPPVNAVEAGHGVDMASGRPAWHNGLMSMKKHKVGNVKIQKLQTHVMSC